MIDTSMMEKSNAVPLEEIVPAVLHLTTYDKLMLIQIIAEQLAKETRNLFSIPSAVYESYTPYEIGGVTEDLIAKLNAAPPPKIPQHAS